MMSPALKAERVAGVLLTDSSAIVDTPSANMENPSATIEITGRFIIMVLSKEFRRSTFHKDVKFLGFFELASMPNEVPARKTGDLPSTRRKGVIRVAKG